MEIYAGTGSITGSLNGTLDDTYTVIGYYSSATAQAAFIFSNGLDEDDDDYDDSLDFDGILSGSSNVNGDYEGWPGTFSDSYSGTFTASK